MKVIEVEQLSTERGGKLHSHHLVGCFESQWEEDLVSYSCEKAPNKHPQYSDDQWFQGYGEGEKAGYETGVMLCLTEGKYTFDDFAWCWTYGTEIPKIGEQFSENFMQYRRVPMVDEEIDDAGIILTRTE